MKLFDCCQAKEKKFHILFRYVAMNFSYQYPKWKIFMNFIHLNSYGKLININIIYL